MSAGLRVNDATEPAADESELRRELDGDRGVDGANLACAGHEYDTVAFRDIARRGFGIVALIEDRRLLHDGGERGGVGRGLRASPRHEHRAEVGDRESR